MSSVGQAEPHGGENCSAMKAPKMGLGVIAERGGLPRVEPTGDRPVIPTPTGAGGERGQAIGGDERSPDVRPIAAELGGARGIVRVHAGDRRNQRRRDFGLGLDFQRRSPSGAQGGIDARSRQAAAAVAWIAAMRLVRIVRGREPSGGRGLGLNGPRSRARRSGFARWFGRRR